MKLIILGLMVFVAISNSKRPPKPIRKINKHLKIDENSWALKDVVEIENNMDRIEELETLNEELSSAIAELEEFNQQSYKHSHSGVVPLGKGDVVWLTNYWGRQFKIEFDIQVTKELSDEWHNVFHMTIGENAAKYGDRIPAVWVNKAKYFTIVSSVSGILNYSPNYNYNLNQWYNVEIKQEENYNGEIIYSIDIDGTTVYVVVNTLPQRFKEVILYESNPWHASFATFGELKDLTIVNLDKYPA